jgi:methyltransferase (TIGR00027 family)
MSNNLAPDPTAARVALWRALHVEADPPPHVLTDLVGLQLLAPQPDRRARGDMDPAFTRPFRASIVARARYIEDMVVDAVGHGITQYVILGAGLDSFAQRRPEIAARLKIYEIDRPAPQAWKRRRLVELGFGVPDGLVFVPVDFEAGASWRDELIKAGFDAAKPALVVSTGVSMYLSKEANAATLRDAAVFAAGSVFAMTFLFPIEMVDAEIRPVLELAVKGARACGTPFLSFFTPAELVALARQCGFKGAHHVAAAELAGRYFAGRTDGLAPLNNAEDIVVAKT